MGTIKSSIDPSAGVNSRPPVSRDYATANLSHENSDEIRDEIASTRDRMDDTLDELGNRLNPRRLIDDAINLLSSSGTRDTAAKAGESALMFSENLGRAVRDNPVPSLLIGAGLAWLALGNGAKASTPSRSSGSIRRNQYQANRDRFEMRSEDEGFYRGRQLYDLDDDAFFNDEYAEFDDDVWAELEDTDLTPADASSTPYSQSDSLVERAQRVATQTVDGAKHTAASVSETVADAVSGIGESVKGAASATASAVSSAASTVTSGLSDASESVADTARKAMRRSRRAGSQAYRYGGDAGRGISQSLHNRQEQVSDLWHVASQRYEVATEAYPLAVGMGCLALGMLTGLLVPRTQYEDEWMGSAADEIKDDLRETGEQIVERGKQAVSGTASDVSKSAEEHGLSASGLLERGERVVSKAIAAASEALEEEHLTPRELADDVKQVATKATEKVRAEAVHLADEAKTAAGKADPDLKRAADTSSKPTSSASSSKNKEGA